MRYLAVSEVRHTGTVANLGIFFLLNVILMRCSKSACWVCLLAVVFLLKKCMENLSAIGQNMLSYTAHMNVSVAGLALEVVYMVVL